MIIKVKDLTKAFETLPAHYKLFGVAKSVKVNEHEIIMKLDEDKYLHYDFSVGVWRISNPFRRGIAV